MNSALARGRSPFRFEPKIEARYEADTASRRNRELVGSGLVALLIYNLFLINDYLIRPEMLSTTLGLRLGIMTPVGMFALWLIHRGQPPMLRETLIAATLPLAMTLSALICYLSTSPFATYDPFSFSLIVLAGTTVFSLRFLHALASTAVSIAIMAAFLFIDPKFVPELKGYALLVVVSTGIFTLIANYRLEASRRHSYLIARRESLRASAALEDNQALTRISLTDPLTRLPNRRQFEDSFAACWNQAAACDGSIGLLMIDVDHFKAFNDRYGHPVGDRCLQQVAEALKAQVRADVDLVARIGGEEFVILLPGADTAAARQAGDRLRQAVEAIGIAHESASDRPVVTISIGVA
ncbi:MAG TPA: diguanylate cyclase, partial [Noviherbaspirillum sp.]|nr:diguanylate cyclase [Noviherbaspirillum sp.]